MHGTKVLEQTWGESSRDCVSLVSQGHGAASRWSVECAVGSADLRGLG